VLTKTRRLSRSIRLLRLLNGSRLFAAPGTLEEEVIDDEEADTVSYEQSSDEGYDEFEEETRAAGQQGSETGPGEFSDVRDTVAEIHMTSLAESGVAPAEGAAAETEEDTEELELEEAQAQAEALLDAEAREPARWMRGRRFVLRRERQDTRSVRRVRGQVSTASVEDAGQVAGAFRGANSKRCRRSAIC